MNTTTNSVASQQGVEGSVWFVTGIHRGLGRSIAEEILRRGGLLAGTVRNPAHRDEWQQRYPERAEVSLLDVSDLANIAATFRGAIERFGRVDTMVSNAAYSLLGAAEELQLDAMRHIVDTNLIGSMELARAAVAHMRPRGGGRLIQISSSAGLSGFAGLSLYCATKWGVEGFYESLAPEVAPFGIQATLVEPGTIRTGFGDAGVLSGELDAYRDGPVGMMRRMAREGYEAPGDPAKMAKAIVDTYEMERAPARLVLGPDAHEYIRAAAERRAEQVSAYQAITMSTDCD